MQILADISFWIIAFLVFWFVFKRIIEKIGMSKYELAKQHLQPDETIIGEFDTRFKPKLRDRLWSIIYFGTKYKVKILATNKRLIFRVYSFFMLYTQDLGLNPISRGFDIIFKDNPQDFLNSKTLKDMLKGSGSYPEFSYTSITADGTVFAENEKLGKLEIELFDRKIITQLEEIIRKHVPEVK